MSGQYTKEFVLVRQIIYVLNPVTGFSGLQYTLIETKSSENHYKKVNHIEELLS